jgi:hypothetical protein
MQIEQEELENQGTQDQLGPSDQEDGRMKGQDSQSTKSDDSEEEESMDWKPGFAGCNKLWSRAASNLAAMFDVSTFIWAGAGLSTLWSLSIAVFRPAAYGWI